VKTTGDGLLTEFGSVVDAVDCACAVQRAIAANNADVASERRLEFRIGIKSATSSSTATTSTATASTSPRGSRRSPSRAASVSVLR
jgi:class 3 adenylate cyclase